MSFDHKFDPPDEDSEDCPHCGGDVPEGGCERCGSTGHIWPNHPDDPGFCHACRGQCCCDDAYDSSLE